MGDECGEGESCGVSVRCIVKKSVTGCIITRKVCLASLKAQKCLHLPPFLCQLELVELMQLGFLKLHQHHHKMPIWVGLCHFCYHP